MTSEESTCSQKWLHAALGHPEPPGGHGGRAGDNFDLKMVAPWYFPNFLDEYIFPTCVNKNPEFRTSSVCNAGLTLALPSSPLQQWFFSDSFEPVEKSTAEGGQTDRQTDIVLQPSVSISDCVWANKIGSVCASRHKSKRSLFYRFPRLEWHWLQWHPGYSDSFDRSRLAFQPQGCG